jgi:hypothetical protein
VATSAFQISKLSENTRQRKTVFRAAAGNSEPVQSGCVIEAIIIIYLAASHSALYSIVRTFRPRARSTWPYLFGLMLSVFRKYLETGPHFRLRYQHPSCHPRYQRSLDTFSVHFASTIYGRTRSSVSTSSYFPLFSSFGSYHGSVLNDFFLHWVSGWHCVYTFFFGAGSLVVRFWRVFLLLFFVVSFT